MAPMVNVRAVPTAWRSAAARGEHQLRRSIRTIQARGIATNAAIRESGVEVPGGIPPVPVPQRQSALEKRIAAVDKAKPFSDFLTDTFNRQHDYLRISITERCNLRCLYCMPEEGIPLSPAEHMLTTPEIFYLSSLFVSQGVTKIRLTGGEPTVRRDIVPMMQQIGSLRANGLRELALTTNGIALHRKLDAMVESGLTGINLSLDTLDPFQFQIMTRRNGFDAVMKSINRILEMNKLGANVKLKVNCVVMRGLNEREILPFVEMGREKDIEVRFIEYMPFGGNKWSQGKMISFQEMLDIIRTKYPDLRPVPGHKNDTSKTYEVPGFVGKVGFITSMTNDFCGTCNRLRITSDGNLKVCLHGNAEVSLRDVLRQGNDGRPIDQEAFERIKQLEMDRHEGRLSEETILGWGQRERELLDVIGAAVKRKAEKHADMGDLENMTNRPMILIDEPEPFHRFSYSSQHQQDGSRTGRASRSGSQTPPLSPISLYPFLSAMPSHNMAFRRAYSNHANTRLWRDDLPLLNSDKLGSAAFTRSDPSNTGGGRQPYLGNELKNKATRSRKEVRETWKIKVTRKKHKARSTDTRSQADALAFLESGGLDSNGVVRSVQSKASFEDSNPRLTHFAKNGVRCIEDWRSKPFDPVSRHLDLDFLKDDKLGPGEESLDHVSGGNSTSQQIANTVEPRPEPPRESGERSETRSVENLTKLVRDARAKLGERSGIEAAEDLIEMVKNELAKQEKSEQGKAKQEESRQEQPQNPRDAKEQALLREVWQHGAERAPLPKHLEVIRRKYKMDSLAYRAYWRYVAGSMITPRIPDAYEKARNFLRRLEKARGNKHVILDEEGQKNLSLHLRLMLEAKKLKETYVEGEEDGREEENRLTIDDNSTAIAAETEGGSADVGKVKDADAEALVMTMPKVGEQLDAGGEGDDAKMTAVPEQEQSMTVEIQKKRRAIIEERTLRLAKKQAGIATAIQELERNRKIRAISERQANLRIKIQNLHETLAVEGEKQREAEEARDEAHRLSEERKQRREGLDHVLDDALIRAGRRKDIANIVSARNKVNPPALLSNLHLGAAHRSSTQKTSLKDKAIQERHDGLGPPSTTQAASEHVSDDASSSIQASPGDIVIDPALTLKLNADTKTLQRQIQQLEGHLSASYPRMDAMPYVISQSENRNTLQTWLRILAKRLKSRDDNVDEWSEEKTEVKAVLDQMVRDHDLDNEAARRMAKRWEDIVQKRGGVLDDVDDGVEIEMFEVNVAEEVPLAAENEELDVETMKSAVQSVSDTEVEEELDMDEFDAGGMSFLNADEREVYKDLMESGFSAEEDEVPAAAQNTELDAETEENVQKATQRSNPRSAARRARATTNPLVTSSRRGKNVDEFDAECMSFMNAEEAEVHKELMGSGWFAEGEGDVETAENVEKAAKRSNSRSAATRARAATNPLVTSSRKGKRIAKDSAARRLYSTSSRPPLDPAPSTSSTPAAKSPTPSLPHLTSSGSAHMVSVSSKAHTIRTAIAVGTVHFSNPTPLSLINSASLKKGDVLAVSRVAGIMAAKKCPEIVPLCHPIPLTHVGVELRVLDAAAARSEDDGGRGVDMGYGAVAIEAKVQCTGPTGVEMEALTAVMGAALSVVDMCKAVDKFQRVQDVRVVLKEGGKSGVWKEEGWKSRVNE